MRIKAALALALRRAAHRLDPLNRPPHVRVTWTRGVSAPHVWIRFNNSGKTVQGYLAAAPLLPAPPQGWGRQ